ncbi:hypothetical protein V5735_01630 (plasmid) [Haladaptatus sp. SPP-AMP-3]|uniref:hypothetical protein n=1 Tax=Haladaptatus sp. SPP-AMP-3 TaxID=3121295 RepID=UPI003C2B32E9
MPDDLQNSILTQRMRDYLQGEGYDDHDAERMTRKRIRERLRASIFDIQLIASELPLHDLDKAFTEPEEREIEPGFQLPLANSVSALPMLLYLIHREAEMNPNTPNKGWRTELEVESGIEKALVRLGESYEAVDVNITIEGGVPLKELAESELASLSTDMLKQLLAADEITSEEFAEATIQKSQDE